jgi:iron(III) transport system permease protein
MGNKINIWYFSSFIISIIVAVPIITVFSSFFETTGDYVSVLKNTFLLDYIYNSLILLTGVLTLTFIIGVGCAYLKIMEQLFRF